MDPECEEILIDVPWGKVAALCWGNKDGPTVIMLHGNLDSAATFFPLLEYFPKELRVIMPELPGCGKSTPFPPDQIIYMMDYVFPLRMVVEYFEVTNFTFIAHSMGMQVGLLYNGIYPGDMIKLVAIDHISYSPVDPHNIDLWYASIFERFYNRDNYKKYTSVPENNPQYTYEKALDTIMKNRGLTITAGEIVLSRALVPTQDGLYRFCWDQRLKCNEIPMFSSHYQREIFGKINIPYLTIIASESVDRIVVPNVKTFLLEIHMENNPNYRVVVIDGNHDMHMNKPDVVAKYLVPFLMGSESDREESVKTVLKIKEKVKAYEKAEIQSKL